MARWTSQTALQRTYGVVLQLQLVAACRWAEVLVSCRIVPAQDLADQPGWFLGAAITHAQAGILRCTTMCLLTCGGW
ncbi:hypothetical protein LX36DRAFT_196431 [Colletotrichum falcatum]|nr:hypothetical protein LX36DRAFT_196431 [Colletotrichum falcatum]